MPNIKSAKKRVLVSRANYERNKAYRSALRTAVKKADAAIDAGLCRYGGGCNCSC